MGLRYIGSKARVAAEILDIVGAPGDGAGRFVDAFCGTGAVAQVAAERGWAVHLNDALLSSTIIASARLVGADQVRMAPLGGYAAAVERLDALRPRTGFVTREYSPRSVRTCGLERRYFTVENARRIDAIRAQIQAWHDDGLLAPAEFRLLVADLMIAANRVANIAGTYGCFLREWSPVALRPLAMAPRRLAEHGASVTVSVADVLAVPYADGDVAYFDPPYTKRQYAAYYHILETIAAGDEPVVDGVTGLRPWKHLASDYCYRTRAMRALDRLVTACPAGRIFLSYSSEGHVRRDDLEEVLAAHGDLVVHRLGLVGRYRSNVPATRRSHVDEYLFEVTRPAAALDAVA